MHRNCREKVALRDMKTFFMTERKIIISLRQIVQRNQVMRERIKTIM